MDMNESIFESFEAYLEGADSRRFDLDQGL